MNTLMLPIVVVLLVGWLVIDAFIICRLMNNINDMGNLEMLVFSLESDNRYLREANEKLIDEDMRKSNLGVEAVPRLYCPFWLDGYTVLNIAYAELPKKIRCRIIGPFPLFESNVILSYDTFGEFHHANVRLNYKQSFKDKK